MQQTITVIVRQAKLMSDEDRILSSNTNDGKRPLAMTIAMFIHQITWQETRLAMTIKFAGVFLAKEPLFIGFFCKK